MAIARLAWIVTVLIALLTALLLLLAGYTGYAGLSVAVGASAAINLLSAARREPREQCARRRGPDG